MQEKKGPPSSQEIAQRLKGAAFEGVDLSGLKSEPAQSAQEESLSEHLRQKEAEGMKPGGVLPPSRVSGVKHTSFDRKIAQAKLDRRRKAGATDPADGVIPPVSDKQPYVFRQGDEFAATSRDWKEKKYENVKSAEILPDSRPKLIRERIDEITQPELRQIVADFWAHRDIVEGERAKKGSRFTSLANTLTLGLRRNKINDDAEIINFEKESQNRYRELIAAGIRTYANDKIQLKNFLDLYGDPNKIFCETHDAELGKRAQFGFPENILAGFYKIGKKWSELKPWQKAVYGAAAGSLVAGGALFVGTGTFGAAALTAGYRWGFRGFGAMAMGIGKKIALETERKKEMDSESEKVVDEMMMVLGQFENNIDMGIAIVLDGKKSIADIRKNYEETSKKNTKQALKLVGWTALISTLVGEGLRAGSQYTGINVGTILNKISEKTGITLGGVKESISHFLSGDQELVKSLGGGGATTQAQEVIAAKPSAGSLPSPEPNKLSLGELENANPDKHIDEAAKNLSKMFTGGIEPEVKAGGSLQNWAETTQFQKPSVISEQVLQTPEIAKPRFEDVSVKIKEGGNMWGSIESKIKADPSAYGLDKTDPHFKTSMNRKIAGMLHDFADKKGISYKQLDKVFEGDNFKIKHDMAGNPYLDDFHGKAFGSDVSHSGTGAAQEIASNKPHLAPEDVKHGPGVAAEHQPASGGGQIAPEDLKPRTGVGAEQQPMRDGQELTPQQRGALIAQADQELAERHPGEVAANAEKLANINHRVYLANRPLLGNVFHKFGISNYYDIYDQPMSKWDQLIGTGPNIAQDVSQADAINTSNEAWKQLNDLKSMLKYYDTDGRVNIGECLRRALADPRIGRSGGSIGAEVQRAINEILGNKK